MFRVFLGYRGSTCLLYMYHVSRGVDCLVPLSLSLTPRHPKTYVRRTAASAQPGRPSAAASPSNHAGAGDLRKWLTGRLLQSSRWAFHLRRCH